VSERALLARSGPRTWCGALLLALAAACAEAPSEAHGYELALELQPSPPTIGPATAVLVVTDHEGRAVEGARVSLEGNMNHAGMVPVFADAREVEPGRYEAGFEFTMGGDWFLLVDAETAEGRMCRWQRDVPGVSRARSGE
jgi:hypothetical protein